MCLFRFFLSLQEHEIKNSTLVIEGKYSHVLQVGKRRPGKGREYKRKSGYQVQITFQRCCMPCSASFSP